MCKDNEIISNFKIKTPINLIINTEKREQIYLK